MYIRQFYKTEYVICNQSSEINWEFTSKLLQFAEIWKFSNHILVRDCRHAYNRTISQRWVFGWSGWFDGVFGSLRVSFRFWLGNTSAFACDIRPIVTVCLVSQTTCVYCSQTSAGVLEPVMNWFNEYLQSDFYFLSSSTSRLYDDSMYLLIMEELATK